MSIPMQNPCQRLEKPNSIWLPQIKNQSPSARDTENSMWQEQIVEETGPEMTQVML